MSLVSVLSAADSNMPYFLVSNQTLNCYFQNYEDPSVERYLVMHC